MNTLCSFFEQDIALNKKGMSTPENSKSPNPPGISCVRTYFGRIGSGGLGINVEPCPRLETCTARILHDAGLCEFKDAGGFAKTAKEDVSAVAPNQN